MHGPTGPVYIEDEGYGGEVHGSSVDGVHGLRMELALRVLRREVQHLRRESERSVIDAMDFR